ncbi:Mediator of RNA polymerase II transcription subunit 2 [Kluyveromyces marxianus]|nr:Mediator of RNA polymerase II transcription subunit 2 [Kluyveromyces marxianus]
MAAKGVVAEKQDNKLTQCFDDILRLAADLLSQQQLKTIKLDPQVTTGFSQAQQKVLKDRLTHFYSLIDTLDVSLQTTAEYVDAQQKLEQQKLEQQKLEQQKLEQQKLEQQKYSAKNTPMDMLTSFDSDLPSAGVAQPQGFNSDFGDLNGMDLSMFDSMDNQGSFGGLQSSSGINEKKNDPQMNFNDTNAPPSAVAVPESENPNSYLTLNDFNDLGIDWNAANDNNELNLEDFNL